MKLKDRIISASRWVLLGAGALAAILGGTTIAKHLSVWHTTGQWVGRTSSLYLLAFGVMAVLLSYNIPRRD